MRLLSHVLRKSHDFIFMYRCTSTDEEVLSSYLRRLCCDVTIQSKKDGFFSEYVSNLYRNLSPNILTEFSRLKSDTQRISFLWQQQPVHELVIQEQQTSKNDKISEDRRLAGNKAYQDQDYKKALKIYTQSVVRATANEEALSYAYANRSAALFHLEYYALCLQDIQLALNHNYPDKLRYKLFDRKGQCLEKMGQLKQAKISYELAIELLKKSELSTSKQTSIDESLRKKVNSIKSNSQKCVPIISQNIIKKEPLHNKLSKSLPSASNCVTVKQSNEQGRYMVATEDIPAGVPIIRELPIGSVLDSDKNGRYCAHCFKYLIAPVPCLQCSNVVFCSIFCRDTSAKCYHKWECPFLNLLAASGMALNSYAALRIVTEKGLQYFKKLKLTNRYEIPSERKPQESSHFSSFFNLTTLSEIRDTQDFFHRTLMAIFLLKVLMAAGFFETNNTGNEHLTTDQAMIGSLLLTNLQIIHLNAHEISWVTHSEGHSFKECKSALVGLGVYPTAAFLNHSCVPTVGRYFDGKEMTIVTLRPIKKGDSIDDNYGPIFSKQTFEERQRKLLARYWFKCQCVACDEKWPLYEFMETNVFFKCFRCLKSHCKCRCKKKMNLENKKDAHNDALQDYSEAIDQMSEGNLERSHKLLVSAVTFWHSNLCLPFKEYHLAVESLRLLTAARGADYSIKML